MTCWLNHNPLWYNMCHLFSRLNLTRQEEPVAFPHLSCEHQPGGNNQDHCWEHPTAHLWTGCVQEVGFSTNSWSSGVKEKAALSPAVCCLFLALLLSITPWNAAVWWPVATTGNRVVFSLWESSGRWGANLCSHHRITLGCLDLAPGPS